MALPISFTITSMTEALTSNFLYIILAIGMASAAGIIGPFAIMRRLALASDPISHVALPGLGVAFLLKINPLVGAAFALIVGAILIWQLEKRTGLSTDVLIGVIFSVSLALGSLITPNEELIDALLGSYTSVGLIEFIIGLIASATIIGFVLYQKHKLTLASLSPDLAKTSGLDVNRLNLYFLLAFVLTMLLGLRYMGVLLMGSLIIIPAAVGKNLGRSLNSMLVIGVITAVVSTSLGLLIAPRFNLEPGPTIIVVAAILFFLSFLFRRKS
ncbi:MAG: metal ABC transporter permease [bacterium]|nr:metal ABC transporter permease [bacterium]